MLSLSHLVVVFVLVLRLLVRPRRALPLPHAAVVSAVGVGVRVSGAPPHRAGSAAGALSSARGRDQFNKVQRGGHYSGSEVESAADKK